MIQYHETKIGVVVGDEGEKKRGEERRVKEDDAPLAEESIPSVSAAAGGVQKAKGTLKSRAANTIYQVELS